MSFLSKFKKNKEIKNFNSNMFLEKLKKNYDLVIVFGAGIIGSKLINQYKKKYLTYTAAIPKVTEVWTVCYGLYLIMISKK